MQTNQTKPSSYMQELDAWIQERVIDPLSNALSIEYPSDPRIEDEIEETVHTVKKAIREKVLESYHNGQAAGPAKADNRRRYVKR